MIFRVFFGCQNHDYENFKSVPLKLCIIAILTVSFSHLNGNDVTSRFARPKNTLKIHIKSENFLECCNIAHLDEIAYTSLQYFELNSTNLFTCSLQTVMCMGTVRPEDWLLQRFVLAAIALFGTDYAT
jgi:hypothetical protein